MGNGIGEVGDGLRAVRQVGMDGTIGVAQVFCRPGVGGQCLAFSLTDDLDLQRFVLDMAAVAGDDEPDVLALDVHLQAAQSSVAYHVHQPAVYSPGMEEHVIDGGAMNDLSGILHQHIGILAGGQCRHLLQVAEQVAQRSQQMGEGMVSVLTPFS